MKLKIKRIKIIIASVILIFVGVISIIGLMVWNASRNVSLISDSTFSVDIDPMVGGGITGAVDSYQINSSGKVYNINSSDYKTATTKTLIKNISSREVEELRDSFIDSGVMDINSGVGPKYGESMLTVIINGKEKIFYDLSSSKFDGFKLKIRDILGSQISI